MAEIKIISENPISMVVLKEKINQIEKRDKDLGNRGKKVKEYLDHFVKLDKKKADEIAKKINDLNIPRLKERQISKIIDVMPKDMESLKIILTGENITVKQEDLEKILEVIVK